jgi:hypothetical protein
MAGITNQDLRWALDEAKRLAHLYESGSLIGHDDDRGSVVSAVEFLRLKAGARSEFYLRSADAAKRLHMAHAPNVVARSLIGWVDFVQHGIAEIPVEAQAQIAAANDLMEQVEALLRDPRVHPAAPVMLAGAALEEMLRSLVNTFGVKPRGKPGINSYAASLREADVLSAQEVKDVTSWAGLRNHAAHGQFEQIELANARLMAQGINLFMQKHAP